MASFSLEEGEILDDFDLPYTLVTRHQNHKNTDNTPIAPNSTVVLHMSVAGKTCKQLNQIKLLQFLINLCGNTPHITTKHAITGALRITCSRGQADKLLANRSWQFGSDTLSFVENIGQSQKKAQGLVRGVAVDYSKQDMLEALEAQGVCDLRRFERVQDGERTPTTTVLLTFTEGLPCPQHIQLGTLWLRISEFIPTAPRCGNCQLYGHTRSKCTRQAKCAKCGDCHAARECQATLTADKCVNCGGSHRTGNKMCRFAKNAVVISRTATRQNLSYAEAARQLHGSSNTTARAQAHMHDAGIKPANTTGPTAPPPASRQHDVMTTTALPVTNHNTATAAATPSTATAAGQQQQTTQERAVNADISPIMTPTPTTDCSDVICDARFVAMLSVVLTTVSQQEQPCSSVTQMADFVLGKMRLFFRESSVPSLEKVMSEATDAQKKKVNKTQTQAPTPAPAKPSFAANARPVSSDSSATTSTPAATSATPIVTRPAAALISSSAAAVSTPTSVKGATATSTLTLTPVMNPPITSLKPAASSSAAILSSTPTSAKGAISTSTLTMTPAITSPITSLKPAPLSSVAAAPVTACTSSVSPSVSLPAVTTSVSATIAVPIYTPAEAAQMAREILSQEKAREALQQIKNYKRQKAEAQFALNESLLKQQEEEQALATRKQFISRSRSTDSAKPRNKQLDL